MFARMKSYLRAGFSFACVQGRRPLPILVLQGRPGWVKVGHAKLRYGYLPAVVDLSGDAG
jgi:hypothetical protein